jgi:hypothetical protein
MLYRVNCTPPNFLVPFCCVSRVLHVKTLASFTYDPISRYRNFFELSDLNARFLFLLQTYVQNLRKIQDLHRAQSQIIVCMGFIGEKHVFWTLKPTQD